jgi:hypothetical protein
MLLSAIDRSPGETIKAYSFMQANAATPARPRHHVIRLT